MTLADLALCKSANWRQAFAHEAKPVVDALMSPFKAWGQFGNHAMRATDHIDPNAGVVANAVNAVEGLNSRGSRSGTVGAMAAGSGAMLGYRGARAFGVRSLLGRGVSSILTGAAAGVGAAKAQKALHNSVTTPQAPNLPFMNKSATIAFAILNASDIIKSAYDADQDQEYRQLNSNPVGRYLDMKALRNQSALEHPIRGALGASAGIGLSSLAGGALGAGGAAALGKDRDTVIQSLLAGLVAGGYGGAMLGAGEAGSTMATQGLTEGQRERTLAKTDRDLKQRSTIGNAAHSGAKLALPAGVIAALLSGAAANSQGADAGDTLGAAATGGALGAAGGFAAGGVGGLFNSMIHKNTSPETHGRARQMLTRHPAATALPFGDLVGASDA